MRKVCDTSEVKPLRTVCFFPERAKREAELRELSYQTLEYYLDDDLNCDHWIIVTK